MKPTPEISSLTDALLARFGSSDRGLTAAVDLAVLVAMADDRIDKDEMAALAASINGFFGVSVAPAVVKHLVAESRTKIRQQGAEARARDIGQTLSAHGAGEDGLRLALAVAWASEGVAASERAAIDVVAESAGVPRERVDALVAEMEPQGS